MFWSSEGYFFMRCTADEVRVIAQALALHSAWQKMMARGLALVAVEEPGVDELRTQLDSLQQSAQIEGALRLSEEGLGGLRSVIGEILEMLRNYMRAPADARSQGRGQYGMLEDAFGEDMRDLEVASKVAGQLQALSQRIGLEAN